MSMNFEQMSDMTLVQYFREHRDKKAAGALFQRYVDDLYCMACSILRNRTVAEDAVQTTFLIVIDELPTVEYRDEKGIKLRTMKILINTCRKKIKGDYRRSRRERIAAETPRGGEQGGGEEKEKLLHAVMNEMKSLPERYRTPLVLHYQQNMTFKEIGTVLSKSENTIYTQARRGIAKLRMQLNRAGITASAVVIGDVLKSNNVTPAPAGLRQQINSLVHSNISKAQRSTLLKTYRKGNSLIWKSALAVMLGTGIVVGVLCSGVLPHDQVTSVPKPSESILPASPVTFSTNFNSPSGPPELLSPHESMLFGFIPNGGRNGTGCIQAVSDHAVLLINIPIKSFPVKLTYWYNTAKDGLKDHYRYVYWNNSDYYISGAEGECLKATNSWIKCETYITEKVMFLYVSGRLTGFRYTHRCLDPRLVFVLSKGGQIDDIDIQPLDITALPEMDFYISELKKIRIPTKEEGDIPWPSHLKSPFPGKKTIIHFWQSESYLKGKK